MSRGLIGTINDEIASGGTITGDLTVEGDLTIQGSGTSSNYDEVIDGHVQVTSTNKLKFGGSTSSDSDTYILESSADVLDFYAGNVQMLQLLEGGTDYIWSPVDDTIFAMGAGKDLQISISSDDVLIANATQDKDIKFNGDDGGSSITALTLDMSEAGAATFNGDVTVGALLKMPSNTAAKILIGDGTSYEEQAVSGDVSINSSGVVAISSGVIVDADVNASAAIAISKTALVAGTNISLSTNTLNVDDAFLINSGDDTTSGVITSGGYKLTKSDGGGDVTIQFQQGGTTTYTMGIDDAVSSGTADLFKIHSDTALADSSDFIMDKSGNVTIGGDLTVSGGDITLGGTSIFSGGDTTSLNNIDAIDATTESTIEAAIDTLANLTSVQGNTLTLAGNFVTQNNNVTINAAGGARTLTLNESLTVGDGNDGTITFSGASKTLTVEDTSVVNQDLSSDANPTFAGATAGNIKVGVTADGEIDTSSGNLTLDSAGGTVAIDDAATVASTLGVTGAVTVGSSGNGANVTFYSGSTDSVGFQWDEDGGTGSANGALTLGANDHGVDFTVYGDTNLQKMVWDSSDNKLTVTGTIQTNDLELQNDRGHYLIVEEEEYLSIRNEKTGKLYKFVLEEIDE